LAEIEAKFPPKLKFLFDPYRYKVARGGRGSGKSWAFARALLIQAAEKPLRILCTREVQDSIKDSVHTLLRDQIQILGLGAFYDVLSATIKGRNGSEFIFSGLSQHTVESIKSFEGIDRVWVEEGQAVKKRSWEVLIPTIRKPGSEIWVSFNPELDTDDTWTRFVVNTPPNSAVVEVNYSDNPWFPDELEIERVHCKAVNPDDYDNIWEGKPRVAVAGAIYAREIVKAAAEGKFQNLPYDPKLKVHQVWDLGFNDQTSIILVQRNVSELRVIDYLEDSHRTLDNYSAELKDKRLNWGQVYLPHDAKHKTLAANGKSVESIMRGFGWDVRIVPEVGLEQGIKIARMALGRTYFDNGKTSRLVECLKRYRRAIPTTTGEPGNPVHDEYSHGADAYRYLAIVADDLKNTSNDWKPIKYDNRGVI
jgi:phage terminase large subunit